MAVKIPKKKYFALLGALSYIATYDTVHGLDHAGHLKSVAVNALRKQCDWRGKREEAEIEIGS